MKQINFEPSKTISWVFIVCFSLATLYFGFLCGQIALTDPDTCWLVALGQEIIKRGNIPAVDPFSWTLSSELSEHQPYIAYQWLSAVIFVTIYKIGGASALLYFTALSIITSFVVIPLAASKVLRISSILVALATTVIISAGSFHFPCRPEIFSYLLLSLFIVITIKISESKGSLPFFAYGVISALYFALWANLHTGFIVGLLVLAVTSLFIPRVPLLAAFLGGIAGSLLTPYAAKLWQYLPHLFFSQANKYNQELFPLTTFELLSFDFLAFDIIGLAVLAGIATDVVVQIKHKLKHQHFSQETFLHAPWLLLALAGYITALESRRMVPFAALLAMGYVYQFLITHRQRFSHFNWPTIQTKYLLVPLLIAAFGVHNAISIFHAALPNSTFGFIVPQNALAAIKKAKPAGHLLNDPQFGDLLVLAEGDKAQVFIDTRFDVYGDKITLDFWQMANCRGPWQKLLEQYQINWLFFPSRAPIVNRLAKDSAWQTFFKDDEATILIKR